jgi:hypothetical protein
MSQKNKLQELIDLVKQQRDELKLKIHLAEMDARDEYDRLSNKVDELANQYQPVKEAAEESTKNVVAALLLAAEEMKNGFFRVAKSLKSD